MAQGQLDNALALLDQQFGLPDDLFDSLYVERPHSPVERIVRLLSSSTQRRKFLVYGQHGTGKTTEMQWVARRLDGQGYRVIWLDRKDIQDPLEPDELELALALLLRLVATAEELDREAAKRIRREASRILGDRLPTLGAAGVDFSEQFALQLQGRSKVKPSERRAARHELLQQRSELSSLLEHATRELETRWDSRLLVIFDDLEKWPPERLDDLLRDHAGFLADLPFAALFSISPWVLFMSEIRGQLQERFDEVNITAWPAFVGGAEVHRDTYLEALINLLARRFPAGSAEPIGVAHLRLRELVTRGGGHPRQTLLLVREAAIRAIEDGRSRFATEDGDAAIRKYAAELQRLLQAGDYEVLAEVRRTGMFNVGHPARLYANRSVIEYSLPDGSTRFDVNPLLTETVQRFG